MIILACYGLMCILKYGSILNVPRNFLCNISSTLKELFSCSLCLGFWCGVIVAVIDALYYNSKFNIFLPFISSGVCLFLDCTLRSIQTVEMFLDKKLEEYK
tara:strand:- start:412 stop:714 length:303 start_codon:yes stop_codon:yes gene_type:complete